MRILTYNINVNSNGSYAHTIRQVMENTKPHEWYYGNYNMPVDIVRNNGNCKIVPGNVEQPIHYPVNFMEVVNNEKIDLLWMHDDPQRCFWLNRSPIPTIYWMPWDNEDWRFTQQLEVMKMADVNVSVAKFPLEFLKQNDIEIEQIYNPIDTEIYKEDQKAREEFRKILNVPDDAKIITYVGNSGWRKRPDHIIEIASRLIKKYSNVYLFLHTEFAWDRVGFNWLEYLHSRDIIDRTLWPKDFNRDIVG